MTESMITSSSLPDTLWKTDTENGILLSRFRFVMLVLLAIPLFLNGQAWMGFSSVSNQTQPFFGIADTGVDMFGIFFLVAYCLIAIPSLFLPESVGLRVTLIIGCGLNLLGSFLRIISICLPNPSHWLVFAVAIAGNICFGLAMGILFGLPSTLSSVWFPSKERTSSTAVSYMFNAVGVGIGYLFIFILMSDTTDLQSIKKAFLISSSAEVSLNFITFLLAFLLARNAPANSPSHAMTHDHAPKPNGSVRSLILHVLRQTVSMFQSLDSFLALAVLVLNYCCYVTIFIFLNNILKTFDSANSKYFGYLGSAGVILGGLNSIVMAYFLDRTANRYNQQLGRLSNALSALPLAVLVVLMRLEKQNIVATIVLPGFHLLFSPTYIPIGCEILADITWPMSPIISSLISLWLGNILGAVLPSIITNLPCESRYLICLYVCISIYILNLLLLIKPFKSKRGQMDRFIPPTT